LDLIADLDQCWISAGQSGEGIRFGSYSLTRCEPRWLRVDL